jgi:two-component system, sensor histidine kinase PdtaS
VPLGLIVNELVTNAIQHSRPSSEGGRVQIVLRTAPDSFSISVLDEGNGPAQQPDAQTPGLGARMVEAFSRKIDATITKGRDPAGYGVTVTVPLRADVAVNHM